mmetsp:Transcript_8930/g.16598  ORF Transcript_8930/g.16598 Transcript_8930/m.16598 type:complete len:713 (+) Transcript_8930:198-2336(+)
MANRVTRSKGSDTEELLKVIQNLEAKLTEKEGLLAAERERREIWRKDALDAQELAAKLLQQTGQTPQMAVEEEEEDKKSVEAVLKLLRREVKAWRMEETGTTTTSLVALDNFDKQLFLAKSSAQCPTLWSIFDALRQEVASESDKRHGKDEAFVMKLLATVYSEKRKHSWWGPSVAAALDLWATTGSGLGVDLVKEFLPGCPTWRTLRNHVLAEARKYEEDFALPATRDLIVGAFDQWAGGEGYTVYRSRNSLSHKNIVLPIYTHTLYLRFPALSGAQHREGNAPGSSQWKVLREEELTVMLTVKMDSVPAELDDRIQSYERDKHNRVSKQYSKYEEIVGPHVFKNPNTIDNILDVRTEMGKRLNICGFAEEEVPIDDRRTWALLYSDLGAQVHSTLQNHQTRLISCPGPGHEWMAMLGVISEMTFEVMGSAWEGILSSHGFIGERQASVVKDVKDARKTMIFFGVLRDALMEVAKEAFGEDYATIMRSSHNPRMKMISQLVDIWLPLPKAFWVSIRCCCWELYETCRKVCLPLYFAYGKRLYGNHVLHHMMQHASAPKDVKEAMELTFAPGGRAADFHCEENIAKMKASTGSSTQDSFSIAALLLHHRNNIQESNGKKHKISPTRPGIDVTKDVDKTKDFLQRLGLMEDSDSSHHTTFGGEQIAPIDDLIKVGQQRMHQAMVKFLNMGPGQHRFPPAKKRTTMHELHSGVE